MCVYTCVCIYCVYLVYFLPALVLLSSKYFYPTSFLTLCSLLLYFLFLSFLLFFAFSSFLISSSISIHISAFLSFHIIISSLFSNFYIKKFLVNKVSLSTVLSIPCAPLS